ncbi:MAG: PEP-CTERM sorting domain-containing protein [Phycisphaerae bacterium]|nr:PEP-CTERM sorting domain-containing protein [Phycisphaerae bacterium]
MLSTFLTTSYRFPKSRTASLAVAAAVAAAAMAGFAAMSGSAFANEIGIQFVGNVSTPQPLQASDSAGVVAQTNWNALTGSSWTSQALNDNTGSSSGATLTGSANGDYFGGSVTDTPGDVKLTSGELFNGWPGSPALSFSNIPYAAYDVYTYAAIDNNSRIETIEVTPTGGSASYQSFGTSNGGPAWVLSNNPVAGWNGVGTQPTRPPSATYAEFTGLSASSFTLNWGAPGNGGLNGVQIVEVAVPEPATLGLMALAGVGILLIGRKRRLA